MRFLIDTNFVQRTFSGGLNLLNSNLSKLQARQKTLQSQQVRAQSQVSQQGRPSPAKPTTKPQAIPTPLNFADSQVIDEVTNSYGGEGKIIRNDRLLQGLVSPLDRVQITSPFATRPSAGFGYNISKSGKGQWNLGIDLSAGVGTNLKSMGTGKVVEATREKDGNKKITIQLQNGLYSQFNHLDGFNVKVGDSVKAGQVIGKTGNTGGTTGPHLDAMLYTKDAKGKYYFVDSTNLFNQWNKK